MKRWFGVTLLVFAAGVVSAEDPEAAAEDAYMKARVGGKYRMLLRQIRVPADRETYGAYHDYGAYKACDYGGAKNIPAGHWVYAYPYWYVWGETQARAALPYGPKQATGAPDTTRAGDARTAWAPQNAGSAEEWIMLEFGRPGYASGVIVHENFGPGALSKVSVFDLRGKEHVVWEGKDPAVIRAGKGVAMIPIRVPFKVTRIRLTLSPSRVPGYNEIDAVGLVGPHGMTRWASAAASSSFWQARARAWSPIIVLPER